MCTSKLLVKGNLTKCLGVTCNGLASHPEGKGGSCNTPSQNLPGFKLQHHLIVAPLILSLPESNLWSINVVAPFESVDETLACDHSNESYCTVHSCSAVCF